MQKVWTRNRAGTPASLIRSPVSERPCIHQIVLPLSRAETTRGGAVATRSEIRHVHVYFIDCEPLTLVDTGVVSPESRAQLEACLEELGYGLADIQRVVVTHAHRDHMGFVQSIRDAGADLECLVH